MKCLQTLNRLEVYIPPQNYSIGLRKTVYLLLADTTGTACAPTPCQFNFRNPQWSVAGLPD